MYTELIIIISVFQVDFWYVSFDKMLSTQIEIKTKTNLLIKNFMFAG